MVLNSVNYSTLVDKDNLRFMQKQLTRNKHKHYKYNTNVKKNNILLIDIISSFSAKIQQFIMCLIIH